MPSQPMFTGWHKIKCLGKNFKLAFTLLVYRNFYLGRVEITYQVLTV